MEHVNNSECREYFKMNRVLIETMDTMPVQTQRILMLALSKITNNPDETIVVSVDDFKSAFGTSKDNGNYLRDFASAINKLNEEPYVSTDPRSGIKYYWLAGHSGITWLSSGRVEMVWNSKVTDYIYSDDNFAKVMFKHASKLKTKASIKLYMKLKLEEGMLKYKDGKGNSVVVVMLNDLKMYAGLDANAYPRWAVFNDKVIKPSLKLINKHTDLNVKVGLVKESRNVIGLAFTYFNKEKKVKEKKIEQKPKVEPVITEEQKAKNISQVGNILGMLKSGMTVSA